MNSKSGQSDPSVDGSGYEFCIDSCNHSVSTSLRDLSTKYKDLIHEQVDAIELSKRDSVKTVQATKLDLKKKS